MICISTFKCRYLCSVCAVGELCCGHRSNIALSNTQKYLTPAVLRRAFVACCFPIMYYILYHMSLLLSLTSEFTIVDLLQTQRRIRLICITLITDDVNDNNDDLGGKYGSDDGGND